MADQTFHELSGGQGLTPDVRNVSSFEGSFESTQVIKEQRQRIQELEAQLGQQATLSAAPSSTLHSAAATSAASATEATTTLTQAQHF